MVVKWSGNLASQYCVRLICRPAGVRILQDFRRDICLTFFDLWSLISPLCSYLGQSLLSQSHTLRRWHFHTLQLLDIKKRIWPTLSYSLPDFFWRWPCIAMMIQWKVDFGKKINNNFPYKICFKWCDIESSSPDRQLFWPIFSPVILMDFLGDFRIDGMVYRVHDDRKVANMYRISFLILKTWTSQKLILFFFFFWQLLQFLMIKTR